MTAESAAWLVLAVSLCGASVTALVIGGRWIERRACRHEYADILPTAEDVARTQNVITAVETACIVGEIEAIVDDLIEYVDGVRA